LETRINAISSVIAIALTVLVFFSFMPSMPLALVSAGLISLTGTTMCLNAWKEDGPLDIRGFSQLAGTALAAVVIVVLFYLADCFIAGISPLNVGDWLARFSKGGPLGPLLTAGVAALVAFCFAATTVRICLLRFWRPA
jgi:hypothetical protein